jgi:hypothetical protein
MLEEAMFRGVFSGQQRVRVHALLVGKVPHCRRLRHNRVDYVSPTRENVVSGFAIPSKADEA